MKSKDIMSLLYAFAAPVAVVLLGVILIIDPDLVSMVLSRLIAWVLSLVGIVFLLTAIFGRENRVKKVIGWLICSGLGSWLIASPLVPAAFAGRILGILLALRGIRELTRSHYTGGKALAIVLTAAGILLFVLPMTASRLVFTLCGVIILLAGIGMVAERWKDRKYLPGGDDNIIDAL